MFYNIISLLHGLLVHIGSINRFKELSFFHMNLINSESYYAGWKKEELIVQRISIMPEKNIFAAV